MCSHRGAWYARGIALVCWSAHRNNNLFSEFATKTTNNRAEWWPPRVRARPPVFYAPPQTQRIALVPVSREPRFRNAPANGRRVPGLCLEMANMEQFTTAALLLLIENPRHQAAQHKTALLLRVATQQCRCVHVRSRLSTSRRCGFDCSRAIEGAGARHEDSDETQDHTPVA